MTYTRQKGIDFWFEYDNVFALAVEPNVRQAYAILGSFDTPPNRLRLRRSQGTYPQSFINDMMPLRDGLLFLAERQLQIIDAHFPASDSDVQSAFEDFGQGILWDTRPERVNRGIPIHMMDGAAATMVGYHRWNGFIRAVILLGGDEARWLTVNRFVALACAIQTKLNPVQGNQNNRPIQPVDLQALRDKWLIMDADELDRQFRRLPVIP